MIQQNASRRQGSSADYDSDVWGAVELRPGDKVYGGYPGQTEYYTDAETIKKFASTPVALWAALQVHTNATYGRRMQIAEYEVIWPVCVPAGRFADVSVDTYGRGDTTDADSRVRRVGVLLTEIALADEVGPACTTSRGRA